MSTGRHSAGVLVNEPRDHAEPARRPRARRPRRNDNSHQKRRLPRGSGIAFVAVLVVAALVFAALYEPGSKDDELGLAAKSPPNPELVFNGDFEQGLKGWRVNDEDRQKLSVVTKDQTAAAVHGGNRAVTLTARRTGDVVLNDQKNTVARTTAGTTYTVSAFMRAQEPGISAQVRVREVNGGTQVGIRSKGIRLTTAWQRVSILYTTATAGASLDVNVVGWDLRAGRSLQVDDVSLRLTAGVPQAEPPVVRPTATGSGTATIKPTPGGSSGGGGGTTPGGVSAEQDGRVIPKCINARGIPSCGVFFGAAIGGNADPTAREEAFGNRLALRRTYFQSSNIAGAARTAKADLAADRLPWVSFKAPYGWSEMASGKGDAWARDVAAALKGVDGPVWLAIHHEPETDGNLADWKRMQARLAPIIRSGAPNVAYSIILTGWQQTFGTDPSFKLDAMWPGDGIIDILGFDAYNNYGVVKNGKTITKFTEMREYYSVFSAFAKKHDVAWAVGETGYTDSAAAKDPGWLQRAYDDMERMGGIGLAYFDSSLNSIGSWPLSSAVKRSAFAEVLEDTIRLT